MALALYYLRNVPTQMRDVLHLSDRFSDYICWGHWPQEAMDQIGKVKEEGYEGRLARVRAEVQGYSEEE